VHGAARRRRQGRAAALSAGPLSGDALLDGPDIEIELFVLMPPGSGPRGRARGERTSGTRDGCCATPRLAEGDRREPGQDVAIGGRERPAAEEAAQRVDAERRVVAAP
jgi:hypothetical protein